MAAPHLERLHKNISAEHWRLLHLSLITGEVMAEHLVPLEDELALKQKRARLLEAGVGGLTAYRGYLSIRAVRQDLGLGDPLQDQATVLLARGEGPSLRYLMFKMHKVVVSSN